MLLRLGPHVSCLQCALFVVSLGPTGTHGVACLSHQCVAELSFFSTYVYPTYKSYVSHVDQIVGVSQSRSNKVVLGYLVTNNMSIIRKWRQLCFFYMQIRFFSPQNVVINYIV